jgi:hypothetical protein
MIVVPRRDQQPVLWVWEERDWVVVYQKGSCVRVARDHREVFAVDAVPDHTTGTVEP